MKKILSTLLVAAMLLSLVIIASVPASAADGQWHIVKGAKELQPDYDGEDPSLAGYDYVTEGAIQGFHTVPTNAWASGNPHVSIQSKEKVNLKDGVYMEIVVNDFTYAADKWFNFHVWDSVGVAPGATDPDGKLGHGFMTLLRPSNAAEGHGTVSSVEWYYDQFTGAGATTVTEEKNETTTDGAPILRLTISWSGESYVVDINGATAPEALISFMNTKWGGNDSEAYVGFNAQNANKGGKCEFTITKFGTSAADATTPMGDDSEDPIDNTIPKAPIADPSTVEVNKPAIYLTADKINSDMKGTLSASNGGYGVINDEDFSLHVTAEKTGFTAANYYIKNEVSYDLKDFPVAITITKNYCTCGNEDGSCDAYEKGYYYIYAGDVLAATPEYRSSELDMSYDSYTIDDDTYLFFYCDFADEFADQYGPEADQEKEDRINGIRFDVAEMDPTATDGSNSFDVMETLFFRSVDEAEAYFLDYVTKLGWVEDTDSEESSESDSESASETTTEDNGSEVTTAKPGEVTTDAEGGEETKKNEEPGCASVVGFGAIAAVAAVAACGVVTFRKKED